VPHEFHVNVNKAGPGRGLVLRYTDPLTGERVTRSSGTTDKKTARRKAAELERELLAGRYAIPSRIFWEDFCDRYEEEYLSSLALKTQQGVASVFRIFQGLCKPRRLGDVSAACLSRFQARLRESGRSEATIRTYLAHLQGALHWAVDVGMLPTMPKVPKLRRAKKKAKSKVMKGRPITTEEFERMLAKVPEICAARAPSPDSAVSAGIATTGDEDPTAPLDPRDQAVIDAWCYYLEGLWWSGLRLAESIELYWDRPDRLHVHDLDGPEPMFRVLAEFEKGHEDRMLPMAPEFAEFLRATPPAERKGRVFRLPGIRAKRPQGGGPAAGQSLRSPDWVSRIVCRIGKAAGVKVDTRETKGKDGTPSKVVKYASAHDLRRSFGERWAGRIMPHELQQLMRHEDIDTTMKYYVGKNSRTTTAKLWAAYEAQHRASAEGSGNITGNTPLSDRPPEQKTPT